MIRLSSVLGFLMVSVLLLGAARVTVPPQDGWDGPPATTMPGTTLLLRRPQPLGDRFNIMFTGGWWPELKLVRSLPGGGAEYSWEVQLGPYDNNPDNKADVGLAVPLTLIIRGAAGPEGEAERRGVLALVDMVVDNRREGVLRGTLKLPEPVREANAMPVFGASRDAVLRLIVGTPPPEPETPEYLWHFALGTDYAVLRKEFEEVGPNQYRFSFEVEGSEYEGKEDELAREWAVILYDEKGWAVGYAAGQRPETPGQPKVVTGKIKTKGAARYMRVDQLIFLVNY
jgi:hypothetical protein